LVSSSFGAMSQIHGTMCSVGQRPEWTHAAQLWHTIRRGRRKNKPRIRKSKFLSRCALTVANMISTDSRKYRPVFNIVVCEIARLERHCNPVPSMPSAAWQSVTKAHRSQGANLVAPTADTATIETLTGCTQTYRRRPVEVGRVVRFHG
jgi:hypothetical protein